MMILKIDQPGFTLKLTGLPEIRTPVEIDISKVKLDLIISQLKAYGIDDYSIKSTNVVKKKKVKRAIKTVVTVSKPNADEAQLNRIEDMLQGILEKGPQGTNKKYKMTDEKFDEDIVTDFIPSFDNDMKVEGSLGSTTESNTENLDDQAKKLKEMTRKK